MLNCLLNGSVLGPIGLELECFAENDGRPVDVLAEAQALCKKFNGYGQATSDAGLGHLEFITPPRIHAGVALNDLDRMIDRIPDGWNLFFQAQVPDNFPGKGEWASKPRFAAMMMALAREKPYAWHLVKSMAEWSAFHVNLGISPWSYEGMFIMNVLNNVGPYIGAKVRKVHPESRGHLAIWSGWSDARRLPRYEDWFNSRREFEAFFTSIPKLIRGKGPKDSDQWEVDLENPQQLPDSCESVHTADLGTFWKLARPKLGPSGWYLEIRLLPSMAKSSVDRLTLELLDGIAGLLIWALENRDVVVRGPHDSLGALRFAADASPLFPAEPLDQEAWQKFFVA